MADYPRIQSPCPLRLKSLPSTGADFCGQCSRRVHNLDAMSGAQRREFMSACGDSKVCVAYSVAVPRTRATALGLGVGLAAALVAAPALAADPFAAAQQSPLPNTKQSALTGTVVEERCADDATAAEVATEEDEAVELDMIVWVGGVDRAEEAQWGDEASLLEELPQGGAGTFLSEEGIDFAAAPDAPR